LNGDATEAEARLVAAAYNMRDALQAFSDAYDFIKNPAPAPMVYAVRKARALLAKVQS
jgi:hypothetical protein